MHSKGFFEDDFEPKNGQSAAIISEAGPMQVEPYFCPADKDPFDTVEWQSRTASIKDENGGVLFEQTDCQVPADWSALATNVVVSKYFYGEPGTAERAHSVQQVIHRVALARHKVKRRGGFQ